MEESSKEQENKEENQVLENKVENLILENKVLIENDNNVATLLGHEDRILKLIQLV